MRILFDQGTPVGIRRALTGHTVKTAYEMGWSTLVNGELLNAAEDAGFGVFVTTDKNFPHQQNFKGRKLGAVILSQNRWKFVKAVMPRIVDAIETSRPGTCSIVEVLNSHDE
jgi:hypothetical protein